MRDDARDLGGIPDAVAGSGRCNPGPEAGLVLLLGHGRAGATIVAAALALQELEGGEKGESRNVPHSKTETSEEVISTGWWSGKIVLAQPAIFFSAKTPEVKMRAPKLTGIPG